MEQLTQDLPGVAVYLDDILVSGANAQSHPQNLYRLLQRLEEKGLRCREDKCFFAQPTVEYLIHKLTSKGITKEKKADVVQQMPVPKYFAQLRSFLGATQFYSKLIPNLSDITGPLQKLTRKEET